MAERIFLNDGRILDKTKYPLMVERFAALGLPVNAPLPRPLPLPHLQISPLHVADSLKKYHLQQTGNRLLILAPGAEFGLETLACRLLC